MSKSSLYYEKIFTGIHTITCLFHFLSDNLNSYTQRVYISSNSDHFLNEEYQSCNYNVPVCVKI